MSSVESGNDSHQYHGLGCHDRPVLSWTHGGRLCAQTTRGGLRKVSGTPGLVDEQCGSAGQYSRPNYHGTIGNTSNTFQCFMGAES